MTVRVTITEATEEIIAETTTEMITGAVSAVTVRVTITTDATIRAADRDRDLTAVVITGAVLPEKVLGKTVVLCRRAR